MSLSLWLVFGFIVAQRLTELVIARRNEKWMKAQGAYEAGEGHYKWFVIVHSLFFVAILVEVLLKPEAGSGLNFFLLSLFIVTQFIRIWCLVSLGKFWNTKIIILPGARLVNRGPYRFIKHPNYLVVFVELIIIPLMFQAYITAVIFPILHLFLLRVRIPAEDQALADLKQEKST